MKNIRIKGSCYLLHILLAFSVHQVFAANQIDRIEDLIAQGELQKALSLTDSELATDSGNVNYIFLKGLILTKQNELDKALDIFLRLTEEHPELPEPFNNLAVIYAAKGDFVKAREALQRAINTHPAYATAHENMGDIFAKMASKAYNQALQLDKDNETAREKLLLVSELFSVKSGEKVMQIDTKQADTSNAKAVLARLEKELKEATEQTRRQRAEAENIRAELDRLEKEAGKTVDRIKQEQRKAAEQARVEQQKLEKIRSELAGLEQKRQETIDQIKSEQDKVAQAREELRILVEQKRRAAVERDRLERQQAELVMTSRPALQNEGENETADKASTRQDIIKTVIDWAKLWSNQDVEGYLSYYSDDFTPVKGMSKEQWVAQRRVRLKKPGFIKVDILEPRVILYGNGQAQVSFSQRYQSDIFSDEVNKTLLLKNENGRWLIDEEKSN